MRVVFLTSRLPWPIDRGDRLRSHHFLRKLAERHDVHLLTFLASPAERAGVVELERLGLRVSPVLLSPRSSRLGMLRAVPSQRPFQVAYYDSARMRELASRAIPECDVAIAHLIRMTPYLDATTGGPRRIVDLCDCISSEYEASLVHRSGVPKLFYREEARRVARYEREIIDRFDESWLISAAEIDKIAPGHARLQVVPNGVHANDAPRTLPANDPPRLVFTGNMSVPHNVDAARFLVGEILPRVARAVPGLRITLAGADPAPAVRALAGPAVEVTGWVDDLGDVLAAGHVFVAPMRFVAGVQNKVLEAMAAGVPVVTSEIVRRGIGAAAGRDLLVAESADEFTDHIARLLATSDEAERVGASGREHVRARFTWDTVLARLEAVAGGAA